MIKVNGTEITTPKSFKVNISDLDGEGTTRNANAQMMRDRVAIKRKLEMEWPPLKDAEISQILKAVTDIFFDVTYPDPMEGMAQTKRFYVGDRSAPMYRQFENGDHLWEGLTMNFVEQ